MYPDRYKGLGSPKKKQFLENRRETKIELVSKLSGSPKKKYHSPQFPMKSYFQDDPNEQNNLPQVEKVEYKLNCEKDARLTALIYEAISSADRVVKQILNYNLPEIEGMCSKYFLGKQKLYSYLHSQSKGMQGYIPKLSKLSNLKSRRQEYSSEEKEQVPLKQLKRLEEIVYNRIIPLLTQQLYKDKRRYSKINKYIQQTNPEQREGIFLLEKLTAKGKKFDLDQYIEALQRYMLKVMDKQNSLKQKINQLQQNLEKQTLKLEEYHNFIKKREEEKYQDDIQRANELKRLVRYQQFAKTIQSFVKEEQQDYFVKETENLDSLVERIRKLLKQEAQYKKRKADGLMPKSNKQPQIELQHSKSQQSKHLKEVVRSLNNQIGSLKQQYQHLQNKLQANNQDMVDAQTRQKKLIRQNESFILSIRKLNQEIDMLKNMVQQNLNIICKYEQEIQQSSQSHAKLQQEKEKEEEEVKRQQQQNQKLLKHIMEIEEKYKQLVELEEKKDKQYEQLVKNVYSKDNQLKQLNQVLENYEKQLKFVSSVLIEREELIVQLQQKVKLAQEQLTEFFKQPEYNPTKQLNAQNDENLQQNPKDKQFQLNEQVKAKSEDEDHNVSSAVVVDNLNIDDSEPNHQRQDFIPSKRFKDNSLSPKKEIHQLDPKLLSQLSSQKQNNYEQALKNPQNIEKKSGIIGLQSDKQRSRRQDANLIKIEDEAHKQVAGKTEKKVANQPNLHVQHHSDSQRLEKVDTGVQTEGILRDENFYQSEVIRYLPQIKRIFSKEQLANQTINQSLIEELELFNSDKFHKSLKLERIQPPLQEDRMLNISSPQKPTQQKEENNQNIRKAKYSKIPNSVQDIGNLMNYHKQQLLNLHHLLKKTNIKTGQSHLTPNKKSVIENEQFEKPTVQIAQNKLQEKEIFQAQEQIVAGKLELAKLNQTPINKEQFYELLTLQKQDQNAKLRQIIQGLTKSEVSKNKIHSQYKQLELKFNQLLSLNEELRREVAFLKKNLSQSSTKKQNQKAHNAQLQAQREEQPQNVAKSTLQEQLNQKLEQAEQVAQQSAKHPVTQNVKQHENTALEARQPPQPDFDWKDLIPEYFGQKCRQEKKRR